MTYEERRKEVEEKIKDLCDMLFYHCHSEKQFNLLVHLLDEYFQIDARSYEPLKMYSHTGLD